VRILRILGTTAGVCSLLLLAACGGGSSTTTPTITLVGASCNPTSIVSLATSQCTASVSGTGSFSSTVFWTASGGGTISATSGLFTAATVPFSTQVTITATSTQDSSKSGSTTITVAAAGTVSSVTATCNPASVQTGQSSSCSAVVNGSGNFSPNVTWSANGGTINPISGLFNSSSPGTFTITATSQQDSTKAGTATVAVTQGVANSLPIAVDGGPIANSIYVNGAFVTLNVCAPGTSTCQTIDHVLVDTGSVGLRLLANGAAGGELDPTPFPQQKDANGNVIAQCNLFVDGYTWGSISLATIQMAGEIASSVPNATAPGVPIQIIGDPRVPTTVPTSCSSQTTGGNESTLTGLGANGVLGVGTFQQDCGPGCVSNTSNTPPAEYYACANNTCNATFQGLPQQVTHPVWALPQDNNGVLVQLPTIPAGGTTNVTGALIIGIGTQSNNGLGSATVFNTDANAYFVTNFNGQTNSCSYIDSGSNAYFFPSSGNPLLVSCSASSNAPGFYCPTSLLPLTATNQSAANTNNSTGSVAFNVGNATTLFNNNNGNNVAFSELGGTNAPISGCGTSFDWGLSFFYGKYVFTAIEQQSVSGTSYVGPFWAY
jgi:hypothetical protein